MKKIETFLGVLLLLATFSCSEDMDDNVTTCANTGSCELCTFIDESRYNSTETSNYTITEVNVFDNCLEISVGAGGCGGDTWEATLFDSGEIANNQRFLKMRFTDQEMCEAYIIRTFSFNLRNLQTENSELILNLEGWEDAIIYTYNN